MKLETFSGMEGTDSALERPEMKQDWARPSELCQPELKDGAVSGITEDADLVQRPGDITEPQLLSDESTERQEVQPVVYESDNLTDTALAAPEIVDLPEIGEAYVYGQPFETAEIMCGEQGHNELGAEGDCGIVSVANIVRLADGEISENDAVIHAYDMGIVDPDDAPSERGGTTVYDRQELLESYGISSDVVGHVDLHQVAEYVEAGYGVNMSVNAGKAWDCPAYIGNPDRPNHSIIVTGTVRDTDSGELRGLYVCDSGTGDNAKFISTETLEKAYSDSNGQILVTSDPIR